MDLLVKTNVSEIGKMQSALITYGSGILTMKHVSEPDLPVNHRYLSAYPSSA